MPLHTMRRYEDELNLLKEKVLAMGGMVEKAIRRSMRSLNEHNTKRAQKVVDRDRAINAMEVEIDEMTRRMLALWQPAAGDLRFIISTIKIVTDLERMGDQAEAIAETVLAEENTPIQHIDSLQQLADEALALVTAALDAFARKDVTAALDTIERTSKLHKLFKVMQREILTYMMEDPRQISTGLLLFSVGRSLMRIGDHASNIAEMVVYMVKGHDIRHVDHETAEAILAGEGDDED